MSGGMVWPRPRRTHRVRFVGDRQQASGDGLYATRLLGGTQVSRTLPAARRNYDFTGVKKILDVGGGSGCFMIAMAQAHPELSATIMELGSMCEAASPYIAKAGVGTTGTLPNGMAFADNGDFLIANFGTDCLEIMSRDGQSRVLADSIDGEPIGKVNFVLRDSQNRVWITVSTRIKNWMHALRTDLPDGYVARYEAGKFRIVADGFHFTNEIRFDAKEEFMYVVETTGGCISDCVSMRREVSVAARSSGHRTWEKARGRTGLLLTALGTCGEPWCIPTSCLCLLRRAT